MKETQLLTMLREPTLLDTANHMKRALAQHMCVIVVGRCQVEYKGRARSSLTSGERIVLIKADGAVLVHRPTGYEPVNWQPSDCRFNTRLEADCLVTDAVRREPPESLSIRFAQVAVFVAARLTDLGEFTLHVSENEMQQAIVAEPRLLLPDFKPISYEKQLEPGFIDIYGVDSEGRLVVVELKRVKAGRSAALQLAKYVDHVRTVTSRNIRGILAAPGLARGTQKLLAALGLEFVQIDLERCAKVVSSQGERRIPEFFT